MPIEIEGEQVKVSCMGDIAVQTFDPWKCDGVAWLVLSQGPAGEPGRDIRGEVDEGPRDLRTQPGVLIGAEDPRSLTVIIGALTLLRDRLEAGPSSPSRSDMEADIAKSIAERTAEDMDREILEDLERATGEESS